MKNILLIMLLLVPVSLFSQSYKPMSDEDVYQTEEQQEEKSDMNTLLGGNGKIEHGGYGGPQVKVGQFEDHTSVMLGGRGGWIINHSITLGLAGYGMVNAPSVEYKNYEGELVDAAIRSGYGGFFIEYTNSPNSVIHFTGNVLVGWGSLGFDEDQDFFGGFNDWDEDNRRNDWDHDEPWAAFFIIEPSLGVEMNITSFFRLGLEASYRFSNRIGSGNNFKSIETIKDYKMDGFSGNIVFKFGLF